jgi:alpha-1,2-mannosyltransferase
MELTAPPLSKRTASDDATEPTVLTEAEVSTEGATEWAWEAGKWTLWVMLASVVLPVLIKLYVLWKTRRRMKSWGFSSLPYRPVVVGFFHPYCAAGGGGERVLWHSIHALQKRYSFVRCVVYTGDVDKRPRAILDLVQDRFKINLNGIEFVYLRRRAWVEARRWPRLTILGQSLGSMILGLEALLQLAPHVYIETTGYAFTLPLFRWLGGSKTASYVHYPTVSSDMLESVARQTQSFNNSRWVSRSRLLTRLKLVYYRLFGCLYGFMGRRSDIVMVNSSWTHGHIRNLWGPSQLFIVYPPCDTSSFEQLPLKRPVQNFRIVSVGQFRPEKDHKGQLRILSQLVKEACPTPVTLVLVGSCRNSEDHLRVDDLRHLAEELCVSQSVEFKINQSFSNLQEELGKAAAALHTMKNEHFGISVVECMAAGCVVVAHESGGPQQDIVVDWQGRPTGYLASTEEQFVSWLLGVLHMNPHEREQLAASAREAVRTKFSLDVFEASFLRATEKLFG